MGFGGGWGGVGVFLGVLHKKKLGLARFVRFVNAVQLINQLNFQPETLWLSPKSKAGQSRAKLGKFYPPTLIRVKLPMGNPNPEYPLG